ncbi:MAG: helix-hairpin-helix domain-containing protein [Bacteroidales bacterium]|nr:helix-hairpin-helix domain-containing protein [Bacteroidales bacterium]
MKEKKSGLSMSFVTGAVALVFLIVGYQVALFVNRAAVSKIVSMRETPDTVFVFDSSLAAEILSGADDMQKEHSGRHRSSGKNPGESNKAFRGQEVVSASSDGKPSGAAVAVRKEGSHQAVISSPSESSGSHGAARRAKKVENFRFNPNEATVDELMRLGFSEKQAMSIDGYRKKGGRFRRRSDFAKSFVVSDSVYRRLEHYIDIPLLDLNVADSAAFDGLPGIGGYFAAKMVAYREQLGGYSFKEQLMDIYRFDREKYDALADLVEIRMETATPYQLWSLPEERLKLHPYIGQHEAHGIVLYRENIPRTSWTIQALASAGVLKPDVASKLSRCIIENPSAE